MWLEFETSLCLRMESYLKESHTICELHKGPGYICDQSVQLGDWSFSPHSHVSSPFVGVLNGQIPCHLNDIFSALLFVCSS